MTRCANISSVATAGAGVVLIISTAAAAAAAEVEDDAVGRFRLLEWSF